MACPLRGLLEEVLVEVGSMNLSVTQCAGLELGSLAMKLRCPGRRAEAGRGMALQAEKIDVTQLQQMRVRGSVGGMAGLASLRLHRIVLKYEGPLLVHMAGKANSVLGSGSAQLPGLEGAMRIMTVAAFHKALVDAVVKRHIELRFGLKMAGVTKLRLGAHQLKLGAFGMVFRVAVQATTVVLAVGRMSKVRLLLP